MNMNINDLTIAQAKELSSIFGNNSAKTDSITDEAIGKYAIIRTRNEGINFGKIVRADDTGIIIEEAQRIHRHKPKNSDHSWYEGIAQTGLHKDSVISSVADKKIIVEDYSITLCTEVATKSIKEHTPNGS